MARGDYYASLFGATYSAFMERPRLSRLISRVVWGGDDGRYYESMGAVADVADGGTVVDCPCGAGPALRALRPGSEVRYLGIDLSPSMIRRARKRVAARGLVGVELMEADATDLPLPSGSVDLFLSYWGLHCFDDPCAAVVEAARVLRPGGRLVGCCFVTGGKGWRQRLLLRPGSGDLGPLGAQADVEGWLSEAGLELSRASRSGPMFFFEALTPRR